MAGVADQFNAAYKLSTDEVSLLEREIDRLEALFEREKAFVLPGGCKKSAQLDMARAIAGVANARLFPQNANSAETAPLSNI